MRAQTRSHRGRTLAVLLLCAAVGIPLLFGLYTAFDLFGLVGGLGFVVVFGLIVSVAWIVHLARAFAPEIGVFLRSIGSGISNGLAAQPSLAPLGRRLAPVGRFARRRLSTSTRRGLFLTIGVIVTGLLALSFGSLTLQVLRHSAITQVDVEASDNHVPPFNLFTSATGDGNPGCPTVFHLHVDGDTGASYDRVAIYFNPSLIGDRNGDTMPNDFPEIDAVELDGTY